MTLSRHVSTNGIYTIYESCTLRSIKGKRKCSVFRLSLVQGQTDNNGKYIYPQSIKERGGKGHIKRRKYLFPLQRCFLSDETQAHLVLKRHSGLCLLCYISVIYLVHYQGILFSLLILKIY